MRITGVVGQQHLEGDRHWELILALALLGSIQIPDFFKKNKIKTNHLILATEMDLSLIQQGICCCYLLFPSYYQLLFLPSVIPAIPSHIKALFLYILSVFMSLFSKYHLISSSNSTVDIQDGGTCNLTGVQNILGEESY